MSQELLNTAEAAGFLRVSQASIRRWSDAGLLPGHRVGRRRERRFAQSDLVEFLNRTEKQSVPAPPAAIHVGGLPIPVPGHLATFYSSDAGRMRLAVPFLVEGLRSGQPCFLVATDEVLDRYMDAIKNQDGLDLNRAVANGQFSAMGFDGASVDKAVSYWEGKFADILSHGPSLIRHVGEMACVRRMFPSEAEMLRFEQAYDVMCRRFPVAAIYNTAAFVHELPADSLSNVAGDSNYVRVQVLTPVGVLDREKQLGVVRELTDIVAAAAGDPELTERTWVLTTESPEGGWGLQGHANTGADIVAAARRALAEK